MSRTFKTSKARQVRKMASALRKCSLVQTTHQPDIAQEQDKIDSLKTNGIRYGNHRKWVSRLKVLERRVLRRSLNNLTGLLST